MPTFRALSPWQTVGDSIGEPVDLHEEVGRQERDRRVVSILERVGLTASHFDRYPHQLSGGQQQRAGIARAIIANPSLVVLDLKLPDMSGETVLAELRADESTRHIPVVVASADATPETVRRLREAGAADFLPKPFDVSKILELIGG